jgi:hypothetical protein
VVPQGLDPLCSELALRQPLGGAREAGEVSPEGVVGVEEPEEGEGLSVVVEHGLGGHAAGRYDLKRS